MSCFRLGFIALHERALTKEVFYFIICVFLDHSRIPSHDTLCYFTMGEEHGLTIFLSLFNLALQVMSVPPVL